MSSSDDEGLEPGADVVLLPTPGSAPADEPKESGAETMDDIVWFDPEQLAQRSAIGQAQRRPGWWCPSDLDDDDTSHTPCWGALQPSLEFQATGGPALWNDPASPLVQRWARAKSLCIGAAQCGPAFAFVDQMMESLVIGNLFEREPEAHRALLVTGRCPQAWWQDFVRRWQYTQTPEGHPINGQHPSFAGNWLLVSWDVWQQDELALRDWLGQSPGQQVLGMHLASRDGEQVDEAKLARRGAQAQGIKFLLGGETRGVAQVFDPRDRLQLQLRAPQHLALTWEQAPHELSLGWDAGCGVYFMQA